VPTSRRDAFSAASLAGPLAETPVASRRRPKQRPRGPAIRDPAAQAEARGKRVGSMGAAVEAEEVTIAQEEQAPAVRLPAARKPSPGRVGAGSRPDSPCGDPAGALTCPCAERDSLPNRRGRALGPKPWEVVAEIMRSGCPLASPRRSCCMSCGCACHAGRCRAGCRWARCGPATAVGMKRHAAAGATRAPRMQAKGDVQLCTAGPPASP